MKDWKMIYWAWVCCLFVGYSSCQKPDIEPEPLHAGIQFSPPPPQQWVITPLTDDPFFQELAKGEVLEICPWQSILLQGYRVDPKVRHDQILTGLQVDWVNIIQQLTIGSWNPQGKYQARLEKDLSNYIDPTRAERTWTVAAFEIGPYNALVGYKENFVTNTKSFSVGYVYKW